MSFEKTYDKFQKKSESEIADMVFKETLTYLENKHSKWDGFDGEAVAYGLLNSIFACLFKMGTPRGVITVLITSLMNYISMDEINEILLDGLQKDDKN